MVVTVSDSKGIKQYNVPDSIKKILLIVLSIVLAIIAGFGFYVKTLHDKLSLLEKNIQTEKIIEQKVSKQTLISPISLGKDNDAQTVLLQATKEKLLKKAVVSTETKHQALEIEKAKKAKESEEKKKILALKKIEEEKIKKENLRREREKKEALVKQKKREELKKEKLKKEKLLQEKKEKLAKLKKAKLEKAKKEKAKKEKAKKEKAKKEKAKKRKSTKKKESTSKKEKKSATKSTKKTTKKEKILPKIAKSKLGRRYVWGAVGPSTFDCSGFTSYVYKKYGISIPRTSRQQSKYGKLVDRKHLKPGDLIFFDTSRRRKGYVNHVGMYIGDNKFIHASSAKKRVVITSLSDFYSQRFKWARRMNH